MKKSVIEEMEKIIAGRSLSCTVTEFKTKVNWYSISIYQNLSEDFIREFKDKVDWIQISWYQNLSEDFIREFKDKVYWFYISSNQKLSEAFIREFKTKVNWHAISSSQKLSEAFIREFKNKVHWGDVSHSQKLSEDFIREFKDKLDWKYVSGYQKLTKDFIREFKAKIDIEVQKVAHKEKSLKQKTKEIEEYAKTHKLKFDGEYLYAFRNHDKFGRGLYNKTLSYETGKYYKDWHCDMRKNEENSFGLGIFPKGNAAIKVKVEDWGVAVNDRWGVAVNKRYDGNARVLVVKGDRGDGKARVWGFEVIDVH